MKKKGGRRGITLIALVITVIVLLILAGITIRLTIGQGGIITRAEEAGGEYTNAATSEREQLAELTNRTDEIITNVIGSNKPKEKIIEIELKGEKEQTTVPVNLTLEVKTDEEKITNYKWVLNNESEEIGIEEEKYTEEVLNEENTELKINESGIYYLHVLTTEDNGVKKETVKGPISVNIYYHKHTGDSTSGGGCYSQAVYHSHISNCYSSHSSSWSHTGEHVQTGKEGQWACIYKCSVCGQGYSQNNNQGSHSSKPPTQTHQMLICGKTTSTIDIYALGCGKTEETIESATIEY